MKQDERTPGRFWVENRDGRWQVQMEHRGPGSSFCVAQINHWADDGEALANQIVQACNAYTSTEALRCALAASQAEAEDWRQQYIKASNALYHFDYPPAPKMLREVADEIDCGQPCEFETYEFDTNAHICSKIDTEGCAGYNAIQLREFADAIEARTALAGVTDTFTSTNGD